MKDYFDMDDLNDNLEFYRDLMNLREFGVIFKHEKLIEKELYLFLTEDFPEFIPFFNYIKWKSIEQHKEEINNCQLKNFEDLDISSKTMKDINSIFHNLSKTMSKTNESKTQNKNNKSGFSSDSINIGKNKTENKSKSKDIINLSQSQEDNILEKSTILNDDDFKLKDTIETIKFEPYNIDNNATGKLFETDTINYVYDIFYILSSGKVNMTRNKKYSYKNVKYELDFQITNLNLKYFLYFVALLYPNISNIDILDLNISNIFKDDDNIFQRIDNLIISGKLKEYEYIDILGQVTIDYLKIRDKKNLQFEKYKSLIQILNEEPIANKLFNFIEKNKKIIIVITNGKYENFYDNFKKKIYKDFPNNKNKFSKNIIINNKVNQSDINYIFIYVNKKTDECKILREKLIFNYIYLLEKKLEEYTNKKEDNKIENKDEENVIKYKCLKLSEINKNFYEKINASRKLESFRNCLKKINKDFINKLPNLFSKYIDKNIKFDNYETKLKEIFNIQFKNKKQIYEKLSNQYKNEKNKYIIFIAIYELSNSKFYFENFKSDKIKIINYKKADINKTGLKDLEEFEKELHDWFNINSKYGNIINFIVMNFKEYNPYIVKIFNEFLKINDNQKQNYILYFPKELFTLIQGFLNNIKGLSFNEINEILNTQIIESKAKKQYMQKKLYLLINYVDKLLKNKIIINKDENNKNNSYLDELIIKINQDLSVYYNYDICKYNENVINSMELKNLINNIYSTINVSKFKTDIINLIIKKLNKKLSKFTSDDFILQAKVMNIYKMKFDNSQQIFNNIFYKYFLEKFNNIKKIIKDTLIYNFLNDHDIDSNNNNDSKENK